MKGVHWKRVLLDLQERKERSKALGPALWEVVAEPEFDAAALEDVILAEDVGEPRRQRRAKEAKPSARCRRRWTLDPKRSQAVAIMMSSLPPVNDVKAAIVNLDEATLSREQLEMIRQNMPTPEEMAEITKLDGPDVKWDKRETFLKTIMRIRRCASASAAGRSRWASRRRPRSSRCHSRRSPRRSRRRSCKGLRHILGTLLSLGNHMNGGTNKGQADGFVLDDLPKMSVAKDNANRHSLLEHAATVLHASLEPDHAGATRFPEELPHLKEAAKVVMSDVRAALQRLTGEANSLGEAAAQARRELEAEGGSVSEGGGDPFALVMAEFSEGRDDEVARLRGLLAAADAAYADLVVYFGVPATKGAGLARALHHAPRVRGGASERPSPSRSRRRSRWRRLVVSTKEGGSPAASARLDTWREGRRASSLCGSVKSTEESGGEEEAAPELAAWLAKIQMLKAGGAVMRAAPPPPPPRPPPAACAPAAAAPKAVPRSADPELQKRLEARFERARAKQKKAAAAK